MAVALFIKKKSFTLFYAKDNMVDIMHSECLMKN